MMTLRKIMMTIMLIIKRMKMIALVSTWDNDSKIDNNDDNCDNNGNDDN